MIITFANQKGGCGKSSIAVLLGAFLSKMKGSNVIGIDTDKQRSLLGRFNKDKNLIENPLYEVLYYKPIDLINLIQRNELEDDSYYLVDTPNQLSNESLALIFISDKIIIPYNYSKVSMESTSTFINVLMNIPNMNIKEKLLLVANDIIPTVKKDTVEQYQSVLGEFTDEECIISNYITSSVLVQRIDTLNIESVLLERYNTVLEEIYSKIAIND